MREILFRGKLIGNGEWAEGSLLVDGDKHRPGDKPQSVFSNSYIIPETEDDITYCKVGISKFYLHTKGFHINPETVGQFTGLTDKNDKKIFEGDFVKVTDDYGETNFPDGGIGDVGFYDGLWYVSGEVNNGLNDLTKVYYVEVIGNIHDNPELLEDRQ